jgi:8-oxo-dGTP pyrophosphatase MutT (NUDIX family)
MKSRHFVTDSTGPSTQVAALCWRKHDNRVEVLLITSRDTGRWVLPKGWTMKGLSAPEAAAAEAWEEAGVEGKVASDALGYFGYDKVLSAELSHPCMVSVYPLRVSGLSRRFPERKERRRKWFTPDKAATKVLEPELQALFISLCDGTVKLPNGRKGAD